MSSEASTAGATGDHSRRVEQLEWQLAEAHQREAATAEVLKSISCSTFDLQKVLDTLTETAARLCGADKELIRRREEDRYILASTYAFSDEFKEWAAGYVLSEGRDSIVSRAAFNRKVVHIADVLAEPEWDQGDWQALGNFRSALAVPLLRSKDILGVLVLHRTQALPFTERQIALAETFAQKAVIAIENARLFVELTETIEQQRTTGEILQAISNSPGDAQLVLSTIAASAARFLYVTDAEIMSLEGDVLRLVAKHGPSRQWSVGTVRSINRNWVTGRAILDRTTVHVPDLQAVETDFPEGAAYAKQYGHRTTLATPLLREGNPIGAILIRRMEVRPFNDKQIALVQNFAAQAAIAIENTRLFEAERERARELARSLEALRNAQDRLVQTEKLASLGQLTAGIAHEIKNPLNFVSNFSALSVELTDELNDLLKQAALAEQLRKEVAELTGLLKSNLEKVVQHGKRANSIVKNMLLHSREGTGELRAADINGLVEESLNLAYHGARAERTDFTITLKHDFDPDVGALDLYPQEMTRALLNVISNGFYAATKRKAEMGDGTFEPILSAATRNLGGTIEIRIRDNGMGMSSDVREKMFNPFFTTKPTGEGTGLGLSMTHDIIVKQHGGRIDVETEPGVFTEFIITLARGGSAVSK